MAFDPTRLETLFEKYFEKTANAAERDELLELISEHKNKDEVFELFAGTWNKYQGTETIFSAEKSAEMLAAILSKKEVTAPVHSLTRSRWWRVAVAAAVILIAGSGAWFFAHKNKVVKDQFSKQPVQTNDVQPGSNGAILTLASGQQIILDSVKNGVLAKQGSTSIIKSGKGLNYELRGGGENAAYNTITTPNGRAYPNLVLADGSKVWLDAGSSIRFPVSFTGGQRKVEITGQVWFDVAHNDKMPFKVMVKGVEITDVGTEFNVNAYEDEANIKVTLLRGAVSIGSTLLKPGEQAQIGADNHLHVSNKIDVDQVVSWKNGFFNFHKADLQTVMRELSRWYDVRVSYEGAIPAQQFDGEIGRNLTLKDVLDGLAFTNVHYRLEEGRKLVILP